MSRSREPALRLARLLVAATILWFLLRAVPLGSIVETIGRARALPLAGALALVLLVQVLIAERWRRLLAEQGVRFSLRSLLIINLAALCYGLLLPAGNVTVLLVRFLKVVQEERRWAAALFGLLLDRVWGTGSLALVGAVCAAFLRAWTWAAILGALAIVAAAVLLLLTGGMGGSIARSRFGAWLKRRSPVKVRDALGAAGIGGPAFGRARGAALLLSIASQLAGFAVFLLVASSVDLKVPSLALGWVRSATVLVTMLPVSVLGIGLREGALLMLLRPFGPEPVGVLAFSVLVFGVTVAAPALLGGWLELGAALRRIRLRAPSRPDPDRASNRRP